MNKLGTHPSLVEIEIPVELKLPKDLDKAIRIKSVSSLEDARFCRALVYALTEMVATNAFAPSRMADVEKLVKGEPLEEPSL